MALFSGNSSVISRFLGFLDQDDETNSPVGLAAVVRNCSFDSLTSVRTRDGINTSMQGVNKRPITGMIGALYTPETAAETFFQLPVIYDAAGALQYESPVGSGQMMAFPYGIFTPPVGAHMIATQTYNKVWMAFSDLKQPLSGMGVLDPKTKNIWPFGMKPFGWTWTANTQVLVGEVATPTAPGGNGHTYRCVQAGTTAPNEPAWPTVEEAVIGDGSAVWQEYTAVLANRIDPPPSPVLSLASSGTFNINTDVYIILTLNNGMGETLGSVPVFIETLLANQAVQLTIPALNIGSLPGWLIELHAPYAPISANVYVGTAAHGGPAPALSTYNLVSANAPLGATVIVTGNGMGGGTNYIGGTTNSTLNIPPNTGSLTTYSAVISGFPNVATPNGARATVQVQGEISVSAGGGGGAWEVDYTPDGGTTWNSLWGFGSGASTGPLTFTVSGSLVGATNIDLVQFRLKLSGGTSPTGDVTITASILSSYVTVLSGAVNPPTTCTARVTSGQLPTPSVAPAIVRAPAGGTFAAGRDVYVLQTYTNGNGETTAGPATSILNTNANDAVQVSVSVPENQAGKALYSISSVGIYECDVPTGTPAPDASAFQLVGHYAAGATPTITTSASGPNPPEVNGSGPAGNIEADTSTGGINASQGYRYAAIMFMNQNYTVSGFTAASVLKYNVDQDGWQLGVFKIATGPSYVLARPIAFAVADGSNVGPFWWIGNVNLQIPSANFVYPQTFTSDSVAMTATVIEDNASTSAIFNFTDEYLRTSNNVTDRLDCMWPPQAVHVMYSETFDRLVLSGVPGYYSGWWVSLAADPESFYKDLSYISVGSDDGERSWGAIEYRGVLYGMRERSGFVLGADPSVPQSWRATKRWSEVGPCGPRAFDACGMFMIFVHRSGIYKYEDTAPDLMTKEIPYWWKTVNWLYAHTICCKIDQEKHEVHILVPVGNSTVPNQEIVLNYLEGWGNPVHYSPYSGREVSMDACRKYSVNDVAANLCLRMERAIPADTTFPIGDAGIPVTDASFYVSQFVYGSSGPDGTVQAVTPGVFADNSSGIDCIYESVCPETTMMLSKIEGFTLNARGNGTLYPYFLAGRSMVTGQDQNGPVKSNILACRPVDLTLMESQGISRMVPSKVNERWRMRFTNGKVAGAWFSLKLLSMYSIPMFMARDQSERGG